MNVYLFAFAFSSLFDLWVLQAFPILISHLFVVNTLRAFKSRLVKRISVFRLSVCFSIVTKQREKPRVQVSANHMEARAVVCLCF